MLRAGIKGILCTTRAQAKKRLSEQKGKMGKGRGKEGGTALTKISSNPQQTTESNIIHDSVRCANTLLTDSTVTRCRQLNAVSVCSYKALDTVLASVVSKAPVCPCDVGTITAHAQAMFFKSKGRGTVGAVTWVGVCELGDPLGVITDKALSISS